MPKTASEKNALELALATATEHQRTLQKTTAKIAKMLGSLGSQDRKSILDQLEAAHRQLNELPQLSETGAAAN